MQIFQKIIQFIRFFEYSLNLLLDGEETLDALCPACRAEAREGRCPVCGAATGGDRTGENAGFDPERFERMRRGEKA